MLVGIAFFARRDGRHRSCHSRLRGRKKFLMQIKMLQRTNRWPALRPDGRSA
jgi:hypothetical protein